MRRSKAIWLALLGAFTAVSAAGAVTGLQEFDSLSRSRLFDGYEVTLRASMSGGEASVMGRRLEAEIDLATIMEGGTGGDPHSAILNGVIVVALPPGLEFETEPRMYAFSPATGEYAYMYSKAYPDKPYLPDLSAPMADASSNDPAKIMKGIAAISQVLDPAVEVAGPTDPRITGGQGDYSIAGKSWLIPCNIMFDELVDIFDPPSSLTDHTRLKLRIPLKASGQFTGDPVVVYFGGLSTAVLKQSLLPSEIPPRSLALEPIPAPPAAQEAEPGQADPEVGSEAEPSPPEQPIDVLVYSHRWISWETEFNTDLLFHPQAPTDSTLLPAEGPEAETDWPPSDETIENVIEMTTGSQDLPAPPADPSGESVVVGEASVGEAAPEATGEEAQPEPETPEPVDIPPPAVQPARPVDQGNAVVVQVPGRPSPPAGGSGDATPAEAEPAQPESPPAVTEPTGTPSGTDEPVEVGEGSVVEVEPGSLSVSNELYKVPLKEITGGNPPTGSAYTGGSTGSMPGMPPGMPQIPGQHLAPADLGEMVLVPEGYFLMGTSNLSSGGDDDELPQEQVFLPDYYIDKYPVTNRQFYAFVVSTSYKAEGSWDKYYDKGMADFPVRGVTWNDASAYAAWAGKRLPTEAEWEKAARGTDGRTYPWGEDWSSDILPRGEFEFGLLTAQSSASPYGVMATCGVLWQWTSSAWAPYPYNPAARGEDKVLRGGCFSNGRNIVRCANRYAEAANVALNTFGFRCAKDAE